MKLDSPRWILIQAECEYDDTEGYHLVSLTSSKELTSCSYSNLVQDLYEIAIVGNALRCNKAFYFIAESLVIRVCDRFSMKIAAKQTLRGRDLYFRLCTCVFFLKTCHYYINVITDNKID